MMFPLRTPAIPNELLAAFGKPEHTFGPNMRFRIASVLLGGLLLVLGIFLFIISLVTKNAQPAAGGFHGLIVYVVGGLVALGSLVVYISCMAATWVFICPNGVIRRLKGEWDSLAWQDVVRFNDLALSTGLTQIRQCSIVATDGREWGFIAEWVANYGQLKRILREKVEGQSPDSNRT